MLLSMGRFREERGWEKVKHLKAKADGD